MKSFNIPLPQLRAFLIGGLLALSFPALAAYQPGILAGTAVTRSGDVVTMNKPISNVWGYAAASAGLVSTTGVTAKAAAGASIKNCVTSVQVINSHATVSTDVQIRDGAAGTVLWRGWAQAVGGGVSAVFDTPLCGTANTLLEIAEGSATATTGVYVSLQGFTGT